MNQRESVSSIFHKYKKNLSAINFYFQKFGSLAEDEDDTAKKRHSEHIDEALQKAGIDTSKSEEELENEEISQDSVIKLINHLEKGPNLSAKNYSILSKSSFLMLNNYFEYLLADLITYHYQKYKESLNNEQFKISLKELNEHETVEEITHSLILKQVESMLVDLSFPEILDHFEDDFHVSLEKNIINWKKIEEYRERRHLIVHNSSIVNKKYLTRTNNPDNYKTGDKVSIDKEYFEDAIDEFYLAGLLLSLNCWGKWDKDRIDDAIYLILEEAFEKLNDEKHLLTFKIASYADKIEARNELQDDYLLRIKLNKCITFKKMEQQKKLEKELKNINVGTASPIFKLAYAILSDKHDKILDHVEKAHSLEEIDLEEYKTWPIYDFVREQEELDEKIRKVLN